MSYQASKRMAAGAIVAALSLFLGSCFIMPGKFEAELLLIDDDRFTFTYDGEIHFLGLSQGDAASQSFEAGPCFDEGTFDERACTEEELAAQREEWEAGAEQRAAETAHEAEQMAAIMGGIDPSDPEATAKLAEHLLRQKGWQRVEPIRDGVFDVRYVIEGELSHDFLFPMIEGSPVISPFVQIHLRDNNVVRVNAPGFSAQNESNPMAGMMGGMAGLAQMAGASEGEEGEDGEPSMPPIPVVEGTFTIVTSGSIRANNTDEGPEDSARGQVLTWDISPATTSAPMALIDLGG